MERDKTKQDYILITSSNFPSGGAAATYLNLFCRGMINNGFSIRVLLLKGFAFGCFKNKGLRKNVTDYGVPYIYLGFPQRPKNKFFKIFDEFLSIIRLTGLLFNILGQRKSKSLLIYNDEIIFNIPIYLFALIFRFSIITFVPEYYDKSDSRGSLFQKLKWYGFLFNFTYINRLSYKLIVFSHYLNDEYIGMGYKESDIIVQPNLTDFEYWKTEYPEIKFTIGYSGTPSIKDGLYDLFKAISLLNKENFNVNLLVIGDSTFGKSLIPELKLECQKLGIIKEVTFTGLVESKLVKQYLSECRILAITRPSTLQTKAGFPTKLGEYIALKGPVLVTNFGDIKIYFEDGVDVVMAECSNPESIAQKIKWMMQNSQVLEMISQNAYNKAKELLDFNKSVFRIINLIS